MATVEGRLFSVWTEDVRSRRPAESIFMFKGCGRACAAVAASAVYFVRGGTGCELETLSHWRGQARLDCVTPCHVCLRIASVTPHQAKSLERNQLLDIWQALVPELGLSRCHIF